MLTIIILAIVINKLAEKKVENEFNVPNHYDFHIVRNNETGKFEPQWDEA